MHLGISSYTFPWEVGVDGFFPPQPLDAMALLLRAEEYGASFVQYGDNLPLHELSAEMRKELKKAGDSLGIGIEVGTRRLTLDNISRYVDIAAGMESPFLRVVIDDSDYHPDEREVVATIKKVLPVLRQAKVVLAIENHDRFSVKTLQQIVEATSTEYVGICLDTANSFGAGEGIHEVVEALARYTVNLHIKDFKINRVSHKMGFEIKGCAAGDGMLDIPWLIRELNRYERCRTATLEVWSNPLDNIHATLANETMLAGKSMDYLKPYFTKIKDNI